MPVSLIRPDGLPAHDLYHHVAVSTGSRLIHLAGQVSWDAAGTTVGEGDLAAQVEQAFANVGVALEAAGASFADVVDVTVYVVDWTPDRMPELVAGMTRAAERLGVTTTPPATLIGVAALDVPEHLVEVKVVAHAA